MDISVQSHVGYSMKDLPRNRSCRFAKGITTKQVDSTRLFRGTSHAMLTRLINLHTGGRMMA